MYLRGLVEIAVSRDEVKLQRPEDLRFVVPVFHTSTACAGAVTAYLLRRIAYRAGAYAPGIQEAMFHELNTAREGGNLDRVQRWFQGRLTALHELGYRLHCRRAALPTPELLEWVRGGRGHRGAMLPTTYARLHPIPGGTGVPQAQPHAVGVTVDRLEPAAKDEELVMVDPWPGVHDDARERAKVNAALEAAHREHNFHSLAFYWSGWS